MAYFWWCVVVWIVRRMRCSWAATASCGRSSWWRRTEGSAAASREWGRVAALSPGTRGCNGTAGASQSPLPGPSPPPLSSPIATGTRNCSQKTAAEIIDSFIWFEVWLLALNDFWGNHIIRKFSSAIWKAAWMFEKTQRIIPGKLHITLLVPLFHFKYISYASSVECIYLNTFNLESHDFSSRSYNLRIYFLSSKLMTQEKTLLGTTVIWNPWKIFSLPLQNRNKSRCEIKIDNQVSFHFFMSQTTLDYQVD